MENQKDLVKKEFLDLKGTEFLLRHLVDFIDSRVSTDPANTALIHLSSDEPDPSKVAIWMPLVKQNR